MNSPEQVSRKEFTEWVEKHKNDLCDFTGERFCKCKKCEASRELMELD